MAGEMGGSSYPTRDHVTCHVQLSRVARHYSSCHAFLGIIVGTRHVQLTVCSRDRTIALNASFRPLSITKNKVIEDFLLVKHRDKESLYEFSMNHE